jgi:hypothetical protein
MDRQVKIFVYIAIAFFALSSVFTGPVTVAKGRNASQGYYFTKAEVSDDPAGFNVCVSDVLNVDCANRPYNFVKTDIRDAFADYLPKHGRGSTNLYKVFVFGPYTTSDLAESKLKDQIAELKGRFNLKVVTVGEFYFSCK